MNNSILQDLLKQYAQKRDLHEKELDIRKSNLYNEFPRLKEIDLELASVSISTAKSILSCNKNQIDFLKATIEKLKKEKIEILKSADKDLSELDIKYDCDICKDTGYVLENNITSMCKCLKQKIFDIEYNKANVGNLSKDTFENFNINLFSNEIDKEKYGSNISPRENMKDIKNSCLNFIKNFDDPNEKNLLFSGGTGLGKTYLSNAIVARLLEKEYTVLYQTAPVMLDTLISNLFKNDSSFSENLLSVDLLVIDDLGTETMNSMKFTELYKIINTRLLNQSGKATKTIISTNLDLQGLYNTYDERLVSRFIGHYNIYRFFGDDIRFKKNRKYC